MKQQLSKTLEKSRDYTLQVAELMPENAYTFKPAGGGWNFKELMHHIAYGISWWQENFIKGNEVSWEQPVTKATKQEIIDYLREAFDLLQKTIQHGALANSAIAGFHATLDHITHHRGQAVVYLRCKGINPPEYTY